MIFEAKWLTVSQIELIHQNEWVHQANWGIIPLLKSQNKRYIMQQKRADQAKVRTMPDEMKSQHDLLNVGGKPRITLNNAFPRLDSTKKDPKSLSSLVISSAKILPLHPLVSISSFFHAFLLNQQHQPRLSPWIFSISSPSRHNTRRPRLAIAAEASNNSRGT